MRRYIIIALITFSVFEISAQDPQFTQIQTTPLYLNPALTGMNEGSRYALNYRRQWAAIPGGYASFAGSADLNLAMVNSGLGFSVIKDVAGVTRLSLTGTSAYYSHKIKLNRVHWVNAGMRVGFLTRSFDTNSMLLADQIVRDNAPVTMEPNLLERATYFDFGFGLAYYSSDMWAGMAIEHLIEPELSLQEGGSAKVPVKLSLHGGGIIWGKGNYKNREVLKIRAQYKKSARWDQFDIGLSYHVQRIYGGLIYRGLPLKSYRRGLPNRDAIAALLGFKFENGLSCGYSYDFTLSSLTNKSGGSHELSLIFTQRKNFRKKIKIPPCMVF